ncbi:MAG: uroporphyrinogen-III C-methyltransferase [Candidatus Omnitrophica bacterium]|nr:uroporphyrinogen-III C-methyltransferase [Candidatus Omnitrophota bacterium]
MSKAVQGALAILIVLLVVSVAFAFFALTQKQSLEQQNQNLQSQLSDFQAKETKLLAQAKKFEKDQQDLMARLSQKDSERAQLQRSYDELKTRSDEVSDQLNQITQDRDDWKNRLETIRRERDDLMEKLKNRPKEIVYKEREPEKPKAEDEADPSPAVATPEGDQYWAQVLKQKAALQLDLEKARADLDQNALQIVELKKQNAEAQLELKNLADAKQEVERKIKYSEDLANNLSLEVARAHGDQKNANDRAEGIKQQNFELQKQVKQLTTTKLALEKTIAQINQDKTVMQKKLAETEGVIQGRIDEIWQIKQNLDKKISNMPKPTPGEFELPPIIVNANASAESAKPVVMGKTQGSIISLNDSNNFVIVDFGESDGSRVGRKINVYRSNNPIGVLEVIQVRKDISAADIKQSSVKFKVGDVVKYQ